jgi:hypothetical protein
MQGEVQRIRLRRSTRKRFSVSSEVPLLGEVILIDSSGSGYDSLAIGDGRTRAMNLKIFPLNVSPGSVFLGSIDTSVIPGQPTRDSFYLASEPGYYRHFGFTVEPGEVTFFRWQYSGWSKLSSKIMTIDDTLDRNSKNPVQNRAITRKLEEIESKIPIVDREFSRESENAIMNGTVTNKIHEIDDWYID